MLLQRPSEEQFHDVVAAIYESAVSPDGISTVLWHLRELFGLVMAASVTRTADRSKVHGTAAGVEHEDYQHFLREYFPGSIYGRNPGRARPGLILASRQMLPLPEFHRTPMYQDYFQPRDLNEGLHLGISMDETGTYNYLSLVRPWTGEPFAAADLQLARTLMPHLRRAADLRLRLRQADLLATSGLKALDLVQHGILLLDGHGRLLHANNSGQSMLARSDAIGSEHGLLLAATGARTNALHAALFRASGPHAKAQALRLPKRSGGTALAALVMPFQHEAHWTISGRPHVLVCLTDPDTMTKLPEHQLISLFGLTAREAELASDLLGGEDLREIADRSGRSPNTVRTQLARLMAKTSVNRQSDLMRLLARLPSAGDNPL